LSVVVAATSLHPHRINVKDPEHSQAEVRSERLGTSLTGRILIVIYTPRKVNDGKEIIRIISARQATRKERKAYAG
jgi:hypothetical protein